jgi:hypothetical protein
LIIYPKGYSSKTINTFSFLVYPESAPNDWLSILEDLQIPCAVSPLHDKDVDENGEFKKPHYHVLVHFQGGKSESFCQGIIDDVNGENGNHQGIVARSLDSSVRYLAHVGFKTKHQYNPSGIVSFGGFSVGRFFESQDDVDTGNLKSVLSFIRENNMFMFCDLIDYMSEHNQNWLLAMRNTWFSNIVREYQKSLCYKFERYSKVNTSNV